MNNMLVEFGSSDFGWFHRAYTGVWPFEDAEPYLRAVADDVRGKNHDAAAHPPLGERPALPVEQAEDLFTSLRLLGREVEFVRFPGESHELSRAGAPFHRVTRLEILLEWFGRYLH